MENFDPVSRCFTSWEPAERAENNGGLYTIGWEVYACSGVVIVSAILLLLFMIALRPETVLAH